MSTSGRALRDRVASCVALRFALASLALVMFLHPDVARADTTVSTLERGPWPVAVTALQSDTGSEGSALSVCVHDEASASCAPCGSYALSFDEAGAAAFVIGACDPASGATQVTLVDRSALFDHAHVVPRPRAITIQASVVHSIATSGGAATTGGSSLGCTARLRPFLRDLEHGSVVYLEPEHFRVVVQHAEVEVSALGNGWMLASETRIASDVDYDVVEIATGETVMSGHASLECASETDTMRPGGTPTLEVTPAQTHQPVRVGYAGLPVSPRVWITIAAPGSSPTSYLQTAYATDGSGTVTLGGVAAGTYEVRAFADVHAFAEPGVPNGPLTTASLVVADSLDPLCASAAPVDRAAAHFDLPADGTTTRSIRFRATRAMRVAIEAHSVGRVELWSVCSDTAGSTSLIAHNRQVDIGTGHARLSLESLAIGTYEVRVHTQLDEAASIDVTPNHVPMIVDMQAGATLGFMDGMLGFGARGEIDLRFELATNDAMSGGVGVEVIGENYQCGTNFGSHGCVAGVGSSLREDVYSVLLPTFLEIGPPRDTAAFRFRVELAPGLVIAQGERGGAVFTRLMPTAIVGGGFDIDMGPLTLNLRSGVRITSVTDGPIEVVGVGYVGSAGLSLGF